MEIFAAKFQLFVMLLARLLALFSVAPFFGGQGVSFFHRMGLAFFTALIVIPVMTASPALETLLRERTVSLLFEQIFMGLFMGLALQILFAAFQMAGEFFSIQMGFGISEVFDPLSQISLPLIGTLKNTIALFVFFVSGAHLFLIRSIIYSFERIPAFHENFLVSAATHKTLLEFLLLLTSGMFIVALKIALPVIGTLLMVSLTLGLLYKAAPQMNILMLGFPLQIMVGFVVLAVVSPLIVEMIFSQFDLFFNHLDFLIRKWPIRPG